MGTLLMVLSLLGQPCECDEQRTVEEEFTVAAVVFVGTVDKLDVPHWDPEMGFPRSNDIRFKVSRTFKGTTSTKATVSVQPLSACAYTFILGKEYLVYAFSHPLSPSVLTTSACSRTAPAEDADDDLEMLSELNEKGK